MAGTYTQRIYKESDAVAALRRQLADHAAKGPGEYSSRWQPQLDALVNEILNREDFQYDLNADALYQQYQDRYVTLGKRAMMDTLGQAAALTGGYGNSHAQLAGQQAYGTYLQGLTDRIPQLYQLALDRYDRQGQQLYDRYGLLSGLDEGDYGRYRDSLADWSSQRSYLTGRYDAERGFDYDAFRDAVADDQWQADYAEGVREFDAKNHLGEFAPEGDASGSGSRRHNPKVTKINTKTVVPDTKKEKKK